MRRLWDEHIHRPFPACGDDARSQEVALYASWLGGMVEAAMRRGALDPVHAGMLKVRRAEGAAPSLVEAARKVLSVGRRPLRLGTSLRLSRPMRH